MYCSLPRSIVCRHILAFQWKSKYKQTNEGHDTWFNRSEGFINRKKVSLTIYNAGLSDSGQYSCVLNTSYGLTLKNVSLRVVANANGKFIYLLYLPSGIPFSMRALRFREHA